MQKFSRQIQAIFKKNSGVLKKGRKSFLETTKSAFKVTYNTKIFVINIAWHRSALRTFSAYTTLTNNCNRRARPTNFKQGQFIVQMLH